MSQTTASSSALKERMRAAWPAEKLRQLGPIQRQRLEAWVAVDSQANGDESLTVPVLQGMLEMLQTYFPEEIIGSPQVMEANAKIARRV